MCSKTSVKKTHARKRKTVSHYRRRVSMTYLRIRYAFVILSGGLVLVGIAMFLHIETPAVWKFLSGIWVVVTYLLARNLK